MLISAPEGIYNYFLLDLSSNLEGKDISPEVLVYVANCFARYASLDALKLPPYSLDVMGAQNLSGKLDQFFVYKKTADSILFLNTFHPERLAKTTVSNSFYIELASRCYSLSQHVIPKQTQAILDLANNTDSIFKEIKSHLNP